MYVNRDTVERSRRTSKIQWVVGGVWCGILIFGIIMGLSGDKDLAPNVTSYFAMMVPMLPVLFFAWRKDALRRDAERFNGLFEQDRDGYLPLEELAGKVGTETYKVTKRLEELLRRGYLQKCTLERGQSPQIVLQMDTGRAKDRFVGVVCPSCGAPNTARVGFVCTCEYCGATIPYES